MSVRASVLPPFVALASLLPAQRFSIDAVAATEMTTTCTVPGVAPVTFSQPAGTNAGAIDLFIPILIGGGVAASSHVDGIFTSNEHSARVALVEDLAAGPGATASAGPHELRFTMSSAVPLRLVLDLAWNVTVTGGAPLPSASIDVGDDGLLDFVGVFPGQSMRIPMVVGTSPVPVRMRSAMRIGGTALAGMRAELRCEVTAEQDLLLQQRGSPCGLNLGITTTLQQELVLSSVVIPGIPTLLALGGPANHALPGTRGCRLFVQPDLVAWMPAAGLRYDRLRLPAMTIDVQAVMLLPSGESTASSAWRIGL